MKEMVTITKQNGEKVELSLNRLLNILDYARLGYESVAKTAPEGAPIRMVCERDYRVCLDLACALED